MLQNGMLWFDDDPKRSLEDKVKLAAARYQQKHGCAPDTCYIFPGQIKESELIVGKIRVSEFTHVPRNHFWLGQENVWTWCPACMDRTDHTAVGNALTCTVCSTIVLYEPSNGRKNDSPNGDGSEKVAEKPSAQAVPG